MIMKTKAILLGTAALMFTLTSEKAIAQIGTPYIHDPSTIMECDGKYYTFGTGGGGLISEDGWTWNGGGVRPGGGAAPDAVKIGDRYLVAYSATGGGLGGGHSGKVLTMWNKTLDPNSPDFKYTEPIEVASSAYDEDCDAIDAGLLLDPTDGRLWLSYGTYFGFIRLVELDPATGKRMEGNKEIDIAIDCEATDLIYRDGWYYLLGTHGTCCDGPNSTYNIVVGRSRKVTGPYVDNMGRKMLEGGGNPWRGMLYGMTGRSPRVDNGPLWKLWDSFGMQHSEMIGYWVKDNPVKTNSEKTLATIYRHTGEKTLISLATWEDTDAKVTLSVDWAALGLDPSKVTLYAPEIENFQPETTWKPGDEITVPKGKGLLISVQQK